MSVLNEAELLTLARTVAKLREREADVHRNFVAWQRETERLEGELQTANRDRRDAERLLLTLTGADFSSPLPEVR